jgi:alkanesulfonate monooxygenase SsuD/methylene tetrahydromethanopterin reductase-like flavin-dependent oxidoreductase (luciferase family)
MKFSLMTEPQLGGTYDEILAAARLAEREGLVSFARSDHLAWSGKPAPEATDAFATLGGLARDTEKIRICVLVTPVTFRHPAIIAKNAATIDQMSGGRFDLGVGTGWNQFEHDALGLPFPESPERWERFVDALDYLEAAFGPEPGHHEGAFYRLDLDVSPKPTGLRLIIGGSGPQRTPTLAGSRADEYNLFLCPPDEARRNISVMREAAGSRVVEATAMGSVTVAETDEELEAMLDRAAGRRGIERNQLLARWEDSGVVYGTVPQVRDKIAALEEAGIERIYLQWLDLSDYDGMARMVELARS